MVWGFYLNSVILIAVRELSILPPFLLMKEQEPLPKVKHENESLVCLSLIHSLLLVSYYHNLK